MEAGRTRRAPRASLPAAFLLSAWDVRDRASDKLGQVTPRQAAVIQLTAAVQRLGATRSGKTWTEFSCGFAAHHDGMLERSGLLETIGRAAGQFERVREAIRLDRPVEPTALPVPEWARRRRYAPGNHEIVRWRGRRPVHGLQERQVQAPLRGRRRGPRLPRLLRAGALSRRGLPPALSPSGPSKGTFLPARHDRRPMPALESR